MAGNPPRNSQSSILEANRDRAERSRYGGLGAAGYISRHDDRQAGTFLTKPGEVAIVNPPAGGLPDFNIGVAWDNIPVVREANPIKRFFKKNVVKAGVDIDLGCLYELRNGSRGGMQAFGEIHGALEREPYIFLTGDEQRGDREGPDETILVSGAHWHEIERILIYVYIYDGARDWASIKPQVQVRVPGEEPMVVTLNARRDEMSVCAVAGIESVRGGIKMTSYLEYFPGHAEMDRAFGFGLAWEGGSKD
ncbi:MAG TPA: Tellurium resistance protein TerA [Micavibrio sp.]|nr:Tellurium resistance protein TerA [Micavibrio sp.]